MSISHQNAVMDPDVVRQVAAHVLAHHRPSRPMELVSQRWRPTLDEAYAAQERVVDQLARGDARAGYKIALSSAAVRAAVGATAPAAGVLLRSRVLVGDSDLDLTASIGLLAEPELVLVATEDWSVGADAAEVVALAEARVGLELPEPRYTAMREPGRGVTTAEDLVADNAAAGWMLVSASGRPAVEVDLSRVRIALFEDGALVAADQGADVLAMTTWLTRHLAISGRRVRAGELVTTGTWVAPPSVRPATYEVHVAEVGSVALRAVTHEA
jgi:2-keto-4-pentenoate hydratase